MADDKPYQEQLPDITGIFQSDLILQSAILEGIKRLKTTDQWMLKYVFAGLPQDPLTAQKYGQLDADQAIKWFLNTNFPVHINTRIDTFQGTCISISLISSSEVENTLGDVHYNPYESVTPSPIPQSPQSPVFTPSYNPATGVVTLPDNVNTAFFFEGMSLVNKSGIKYQILEILDDFNLTIQPQPVVDLQDVVLQENPINTQKIYTSSVFFRETYQIGVHEATDPYHCLILTSIITFLLLVYRKTLLEQRGLERSRFNISDFVKDNSIEGEVAYARYYTLETVVKHIVPIASFPIAQGVTEGLLVEANVDTTDQATDQLWNTILDDN